MKKINGINLCCQLPSYLQVLNEETKKGPKKLEDLLGMPSETCRHENKTNNENPNYGLQISVENLADLKGRPALAWVLVLRLRQEFRYTFFNTRKPKFEDYRWVEGKGCNKPIFHANPVELLGEESFRVLEQKHPLAKNTRDNHKSE